MKRRYSAALLAVILCVLIAAYNIIYHPVQSGVPVTSFPKVTHRILLVPLDSRPPCRTFVIDAARIAGCEIVTPPTEILDYYSQPGETEALQKWTMENIAGCDAAILSIDQLLHGGLLASREAKKTSEDADRLIAFLNSLHTAYPDIPLYAFNILPRILPPDSIDGHDEKKYLMEYSRLADRIDIATAPSEDELGELEWLRSVIPPESLRRYDLLFSENARLNKRLIELAAGGTLNRLVIGQDDGERYGIPNREKRELIRHIKTLKLDDENVFLTFGADEIALSLLAYIEAQRDRFSPGISVKYNSEATPWRIMPYMAATMETTALEKITLVGGRHTSEAASDFTLYLSANDRETLSSRRKNSDEIKTAIDNGKHIALVDLGFEFRGDEALLPFLTKNGTPLHALYSYAGWNTASNAIGTAVAQAVIFETARRRAESAEELAALAHAQFTYLDQRFLEDYFYLKDIIDSVNFSLIRAGYVNTSDLDLDHNSRWANAMLQQAMRLRAESFSGSYAWRAPVELHTGNSFGTFSAHRLSQDSWFPWPRTFEIMLQAKTELLQK